MDIQTVNIPNLIKSNQYYQLSSSIKNYEDTLQKLLTNNKDSSITNDPTKFVWKIDNELFPDFKDNLISVVLELFGEAFENLKDKVVISGPFVRSCLVTNIESKTIKIIKELYFFRCCEESWEDMLDLESFIDKKTEYVFDDGNKKIFLVKKKYKHLAHVILQHDYLKRVAYSNGDFYCSSMFLIEMQKHFNLLKSKFRDPILNMPYDPLMIYQSCEKDKQHPTKMIEMVDLDSLVTLSKKHYMKLYGSKTCVELCLDKLVIEQHPVLLNQLKQMIVFLSNVQQKRQPYLYAKILDIDKSHPEVYAYLKTLSDIYEMGDIDINKAKSIDDINNVILDNMIKADNVDNFIDFTTFIKCKINKSLVEIMIHSNAVKILASIIQNKMIDNYLTYYAIFMTENFDLAEQLQIELDIDISVNYLKDVLQNGKIRSFIYLHDKDPTILNTAFDDGKNILHMIKQIGNYSDLVEVIVRLKPDLVNLKDSNKETPVIFHAKHNPQIVKIFLDYEFDYTLTDLHGNTFIHQLCSHDYPDILKLSLKRCPELVDMPNKKAETPIIICGQKNLENMFYVLKGMGANLNAQDCYGNTVFHYMCSNSMCLGMMIEDKQNYFGLKPSDYCKVSANYYNFI